MHACTYCIIQIRARTSAGFGDYSSTVDYSGIVRKMAVKFTVADIR